jgi:hypothetical protein
MSATTQDPTRAAYWERLTREYTDRLNFLASTNWYGQRKAQVAVERRILERQLANAQVALDEARADER